MEQCDVIIPVLLVQPFVENAILHGLKTKKGDGKLTILFDKEDQYLNVIVKDNGGGFQLQKSKSSKKSYGMNITEKRLQHINRNQGESFEIITNSTAEGTQINIRILIEHN